MIRYNTLVVLGGVGLLGAAAGPVGVFTVLRRRALVGDALAHATLPGVCLAFLLVGGRGLGWLLLGALASSLVAAGALALLGRFSRVKEDAAVGVVLSVFFAAGIVLARLIQNHSSEGSKAGLESYIFGKAAGVLLEDVEAIAALAAACLLTVALLYKELQAVAFDREFAAVQGWPVGWLDLLLLGLTAAVVVVGLPAVGAVLVAALLIVPAVSARFWTERLNVMLALSSLIGLLTGAVGAALSASFDNLPAGPAIVLVGAAFFAVSALAAPRRGMIARWLAPRRPLAEPEP
jgi:manganese/zinc/iron transport system permease protein